MSGTGWTASAETRAAPSKRWSRAMEPGFHGVLMAASFFVLAWPLTRPAGAWAAALGAFGASFLGAWLQHRRVRLRGALLLATALVLGGAGVYRALVGHVLPSLLFSPGGVLWAAEMTRFFLGALGLASFLRALSLVARPFLVLEGAVVVFALASTVSSHRDGMIARPLEVSDWFWTEGLDPVIAFLGMGLLAACLLAGILASGRVYRRALFPLFWLMMLGVFLGSEIHRSEEREQRKGAPGDDRSKAEASGRASKDQQGQASGAKASPFDQDMPKPGNAHQKNRPRAVVIFHRDVRPSGGVFYFRHAAFSQYNGVRLVEAAREDVDRDVPGGFPTEVEPVPGPDEGTPGRTLVATDVALLSSHRRVFALTDAVELRPLSNPQPARFRLAYRAVSSVLEGEFNALMGQAPGLQSWSDEVWEHYTELPRDPRYHRLAAKLVGTLKSEFAADPLAQALTVKQFLEASATYSFRKTYEGSQDPTGDFLFSEEKLGYCVHLAHSAAFLLRAMGVPARVSAGYAVPAENLGGGSSLLIKSGDAHAWAEIYLDQAGWVPVEVSPEKSDVEPNAFREKDLQQLLGEMARREGRRTRTLPSGFGVRRILAGIKRWIPGVLMGFLMVAYLIKVWRLFAPMIFSRGRFRPAYRAGLDALSAAGLCRRPGEGRERFAVRVRTKSPSFELLTHAHMGACLGSRRVHTSGHAASPSRLAQRVRREVRREVPPWRWLLGLINPVSWWWSA